ncbi:hypothetical protein KKH59_01030 [Patescibacteria group bacterium]|nr:hypothetical protein [Patescibacteria group bacterium]
MKTIVKKSILIVVFAVGLFAAGTIFYASKSPCFRSAEKKVGILSSQQAAEKAMNYINQNLLQKGVTASLGDVVEENGLYKFHLKMGEREFASYVTKDGKILFPEEGINLESAPAPAQGEETDISKSDKPDVKLFVMSYCPYGLQAQKMFLPVYNLLKNKTTMGVYFVDYAMHEKKEIDENLNQYCIQKNEKEKYSNYLSCFVASGDSEKCLSQANVDKIKLSSCISETDAKYKIYSNYNDKSTWQNGQFPKFDVNTDLNTQYGVQGSPTIVINDKIVNISPRSSEKFKEVVCGAFNFQPEECSQTLSNDATSVGIGEGSGSSSGGGCGQ